MRLTIFGASGATGKCLVEQALSLGHDVTAVVRDPQRLVVPPQSRLHIVTADVMDPAAIVPVVEGADAVLSALGPRGRGPTTISGEGARSIVQAMQKSDRHRLFMITGSIVDDTGNGFFMRAIIKPMARRTFLHDVCADMRRAEEEVHASGLDWTIVRPPRLTDKAATGRYRIGIDCNVPRGVTISRVDLAAAMLDLVDDPATTHKHVFVAT